MSLMPAVYNFKPHYKGSTFAPINIKFNFNITGAIILCQLKKTGVSLVYEWKTNDNITVLDFLTGDIVLNQINTFNVPSGKYQYDLQISFIDGTNQTYIKGELLVVEDISFLQQ